VKTCFRWLHCSGSVTHGYGSSHHRQNRSSYQDWQIEHVAIAPQLDAEQRRVLARHNIIPQDLVDLTEGLQ
jgi:hypothetical protein